MSDAPRGPRCPQHNCHPSDCFEIHYPDSARKAGRLTEEEYRRNVIQEHVRRQNENVRRESSRESKTVVDARKRFETRDRVTPPTPPAKEA